MALGSSVGNWALVIGIDQYWGGDSTLHGAVRDALRTREWLLAADGGGVPQENIVLVLGPRDGEDPGVAHVPATKDKIMVAINDLITLSGGKGDRLYFYFSGHGLTARIDNRDESALVAGDFNAVNTDNSIALRSLWEFFETTQFADQYFFVDACRNIPWEGDREFVVGRWTLPRSRDPGLPPVQQFILYATSPGLKATEQGDYGNERGAFTAALLQGLAGDGYAKAWSWPRNCYEVRWERLVDYVKTRLEAEKNAVGEGSAGPLFQIPQDAGSRGVAGRDRDPALTSFPPHHFEDLTLEVDLLPEEVYEIVRVRVLDGLGDTVKEVAPGTRPVTFELPPKTYALRAVAASYEEGRTEQPIELYAPLPKPPLISLRQRGGQAATPEEPEAFGATSPPPRPGTPAATGRVVAISRDRLAQIEVRDNAGAVAAGALGYLGVALDPGFYRIRVVAPEAAGDDVPIALAPGEVEPTKLPAPPRPDDAVVSLVEAVGGTLGEDGAVELGTGFPPLVAPQRTTVIALAAEAAHRGDAFGAWLGLELPAAAPGHGGGYAVVVLDAADVGEAALDAVSVRLWPAGDAVPDEAQTPHHAAHAVGRLVVPASVDGAHWLALEPGEAPPAVFALTLPPGRPPLIVVRLQPDGLRIFQYLLPRAGDATARQMVRDADHAQRLVLAGQLAALEPLARQLGGAAAEDPLAACLAGYALLRRGRHAEIGPIADSIIAVTPEIADAYVLRGEAYAAAGKQQQSNQAFAEAVSVGIPLFGEGLTRLLEGLRVGAFAHPRASIVRHLFQRHFRGTMWSVFVPRARARGRALEPGRLLVTGAETGFEA